MSFVAGVLRKLSGGGGKQPADPGMDTKMSPPGLRDLDALLAGDPIDESQLTEICSFVDARHDCADFRALTLIRVAHSNNPFISDDARARVRRSLLGFRYWMDEAGDDSMCFWSENHQAIFATAEFLAGGLFPDEQFTNPGPGGVALTGADRRERARRRLLVWFDHRFTHGFTEWLSNTYYEEDVAAMSLLVDLARDEEIQRKAATMLDLLLLDMALHRFEGRFVASGGRVYEDQKKDPAAADVNDILTHAFGGDEPLDLARMSGHFVVSQYRTPEVLRRIAQHPGDVLIRERFGLDVDEVAGRIGPADAVETTGLFYWLMEAFTAPESIELTMEMLERWKLHTNRFLQPLGAFRWLPRKWLPALVRALNPATQGVAIQRACVQTYRTPHFLMSTAQSYRPGEFGDQQHIWQAILPGGVPVFATHPGAPMFDENMRNFSPSAWVGNGINPHAVQDRDVLVALHDLRVRSGLLERKRQEHTHLYWPTSRFDEHTAGDHPGGGKWLVARSGTGMVGVVTLARTELDVEPDAVVQRGDVTGWVVVCSSTEKESFSEFSARIQGIHVHLSKGWQPVDAKVVAMVDGIDYELRFAEGMRVEGVRMRTDHPRLDTPFVRAERHPERIFVECEGHALELDWAAGTRLVGTVEDDA